LLIQKGLFINHNGLQGITKNAQSEILTKGKFLCEKLCIFRDVVVNHK